MECLERLEMHVAHACNLTCESCSHFANSGHRGIVDLEDAAAMMRLWSRRIQPDAFCLLGGEPTIHPQLTEFVRLARGLAQQPAWPDHQWLFLHRHPQLAQALHETGASLLVTIHGRSPEYQAKTREILALLDQWRAKFPFVMRTEESWHRWTRRYHGFGADVLPFDDQNPRGSWEHCACRTCRQLFRGRLWKCSTITYLQLQKEAFPTVSPAWDPYLDYQALDSDCSDEELKDFLAREEENVCRMCPAAPARFEKRSPLIPIRELLASPGAAA